MGTQTTWGSKNYLLTIEGYCKEFGEFTKNKIPVILGEFGAINKNNDGRVTPIYSFGHGLSYTTFEYSDLKTEMYDDRIEVQAVITNTGEYDGYEVAQLYIHDKFASKVRPVRELKGYKKVFLKKGESKIVEFSLPFNTIGFHNDRLEYVVEKGDFEVLVGSNSRCTLKTEFTLK